LESHIFKCGEVAQAHQALAVFCIHSFFTAFAQNQLAEFGMMDGKVAG